MVRRCCVCKVKYEKGGQRTFHRFPQNVANKNRWVLALGIRGPVLPQSFVCSDHFTSTDFVTKPSGIIYLKNTATPSNTNETIISERNNGNISTDDNESNNNPTSLLYKECTQFFTVIEEVEDTDSADDQETSQERPFSPQDEILNLRDNSIIEVKSKDEHDTEDIDISPHSPSTLTSSEVGDTEKVIYEKQKQTPNADRNERQRVPFRFMGNLSELQNSPRAKCRMNFAKHTIGKYKMQINTLRTANHRLKNKFKCLQSLYCYLSGSMLSNEDAKAVIKAVMSKNSL